MVTTLILAFLQLHTVSGFNKVYSSHKCNESETLMQRITASFHFVLNNVKCKYEKHKPILFPWGKNKLAIILKRRKNMEMVIIPARAILLDVPYKIISLGKSDELKMIPVESVNSEIRTCHQAKKNGGLICYSFDELFRITQYEFQNKKSSFRKRAQKSLHLPLFYKYEDIISYIDEDGTYRLWVAERLDFFYDMTIENLSLGLYDAGAPGSYIGNDPNIFTSTDFAMIYADHAGMTSKRCYTFDFGYTACLYRYSLHAAKITNTMPTYCIYDENLEIYPGIVFEKWPPTKKTAKPPLREGDPMSEKRQAWTTAYIPIQVLAFITFIYLCFFFFYAFKPHPSSNLVELSVIMEDELIRLSILTSEAVRTMKAARGKKRKPLILMKPPEDPTQESLEDVCCPGTTCNTAICVHEHVPPREISPPQKQPSVVTDIRSQDKGLGHENVPDKFLKSAANAISQTSTYPKLKPWTKTENQHAPQHVDNQHVPKAPAKKHMSAEKFAPPQRRTSFDQGKHRHKKAAKKQ
ncbi:hypothetical protein RB195_013163 [Necator americanus]|uniref:Uncharacterized protein n=1 Tax=Necator americanus TaxID=51031 RepID=A0ABR1DUA4_NECAM